MNADASENFSFAPSRDKRFQILEKYAGGAAKLYYDTVTGHTISRKEFQTFKKTGRVPRLPDIRPVDEAESLPDDVEAEPAPRPLRMVDSGDQDAGVDHKAEDGKASAVAKKAGLFETLAPAVAVLINGVADYYKPYAPVFEMVPPPPLLQPVFIPLGRIADRHNPLGLEIEATQDGRDLLEAAAALSFCLAYSYRRLELLRRMPPQEVDQYGDEQPQRQRSQRAPRRERTPDRRDPDDGGADDAEAFAATTGIWARLPQQFRRGTPAGSSGPDTGANSADGFTSDRGIHKLSPTKQAALVADLLQRDAAGRTQRGFI